MTKDITIENVGPIRTLSIPIPDEGGVVVLSSANGAGKSTALRALEQLAGRPQKAETLTVREGEIQGRIEGLGRSIKVSLTRRTATGDLEADVLDAAVDPSVLVDPGIADPEAADARRIAVLCRLADVPMDASLFPAEIQPHIPERAKQAGDLPEMAAVTRRWLQAKAKEHEDAAAKARTNYDTAMTVVGDTPLDGPTAEDVRGEFERANMEAALRQREAEAYVRAARMAEACEQGLEPWDEDAQESMVNAEVAASAEVVQLRDLLRQAELNAAAYAAHLREYKNRRLGWQRAEAAKAELAQLPNPNELEVEAAKQRVRFLAETLELAHRADAARQARARAVVNAEKAQEATYEAGTLRALADRCDGVVAGAIARVAPMGLTVDHGRLVLVNGEKKTLWANLSHGERWRIALECAMAAVGRGGLLPIRQEAWEGLDEDNRREIAVLARERGVVVVTARATRGELQAAVMVVEGDAQ